MKNSNLMANKNRKIKLWVVGVSNIIGLCFFFLLSLSAELDRKYPVWHEFLDESATEQDYIEYMKNRNVNSVRNEYGDTLLHIAARNNYPYRYEHLISNGADPSMKNIIGVTPGQIFESRENLY